MKYTVRQPTCAGCPHNLYFGDAISKKQFGVMMHCGQHFCTGGKKARRFKRSDPKVRVPGWCPKRKNPCELRIYALKSSRDYQMHTLLSADPNDPLYISEHRYALVSSSEIELTPQEFWKRCQNEPWTDLLDVDTPLYSVVEIDDGLAPAFFYRTKAALKYFGILTLKRLKAIGWRNLFEGSRKALRQLPVLLHGAGKRQRPDHSAPEVQESGLQFIEKHP